MYGDIIIKGFEGQQYTKPKSIVLAKEFKYLTFCFHERQSFSLLPTLVIKADSAHKVMV